MTGESLGAAELIPREHLLKWGKSLWALLANGPYWSLILEALGVPWDQNPGEQQWG